MIALVRNFDRRLRLTAVLSFGIALLATAAVVSFRPAPLIVLDLETELLVQRVVQPQLSTLAVTRARISTPGDCVGLLIDGQFFGTIVPPVGADVSYNWRPDGLRIDIAAPRPATKDDVAPSRLSTRDDAECEIRAETISVLLTPGPGIGDPAWQLPIAGPARAGTEAGTTNAPGAEPSQRLRTFDLLRGGSVSVFGKSLTGQLYPAQDAAFSVPAGSRVASGGQLGGGASWYGIATFDGEAGLHVSATTETSGLRVFRSGIDNQGEVFDVGILASLLADPAFGMAAFLLTVFLAAFAFIKELIPPSRKAHNDIGRKPAPRNNRSRPK